MKFKLLIPISISFILLTIIPLIANSSLITPLSVKASSTFTTYNANNLINNSGLSQLTHDTNPANMWLSNSVSASLVFDLGQALTLSGAYFWQYNAINLSSTRGAKDITILTSLDGLSFQQVLSSQLSQALSYSFNNPEFKGFNQVARFIQVNITSNYGSEFYSGLSEVKFLSQADINSEVNLGTAPPAAAIPEPSLNALLALTLLAWGWRMWRTILKCLVLEFRKTSQVRLYRYNSYSAEPPDIVGKYKKIYDALDKRNNTQPK